MPLPRSRTKNGRRRAAAAPRRRRSADDAKRAILDAAEARVASGGPASVRLQDIAADVGVSHPAILHHFGSREDLLRAVMERALAALRADLLATLTTTGEAHIDVTAQIERVFDVLGGHGQARLMAWFALSGAPPERGRDQASDFFIRELATLVHQRRMARYAEQGRRPPADEDTLFTILLAALALLGDALLGASARESSGLDDPAAGRRFRTWFAQLLVAHLDGGDLP
ncbi:TetR/AcrR family transcriptional regulator [bacterium]|nr:TetR/AcrR family transcriptional regulator [bacterium]